MTNVAKSGDIVPPTPKDADIIKLCRTLSEMSGVGTEYLVSNGVILARFYNGNIMATPQKGNSDPTKIG